jgi:hypothetical protein
MHGRRQPGSSSRKLSRVRARLRSIPQAAFDTTQLTVD